MVSPVIFWFRRDLRLSDNPALCDAVRQGEGSLVAVFVIDPALAASVGPARGAYLSETLRALDASLEGRLVVRRGDPAAELSDVARATGARQVIATEDFAPAGRSRDARVREALGRVGITTTFLDSPYVVRPGTVRTKTGTPCKVFTPFRRGWESEPLAEPLARVTGVTWVGAPSVDVSDVRDVVARRRPEYFADLPDDVPRFDARVGEEGARATLEEFLAHVDAYADTRNLPGVEGTSRLSAHLHLGTIHPRQVLAATNGPSRGAEVFRSEICWREFYADVLFHHPESTRRELQPAMAHLRVDRDAAARERFQRWARGETGYPLVDAGMRQLLEEGWMHNRVRMVCASFLVKHLHLDWRWGAEWFMWRLVDGDVASNQHGWQWAAGTGTDASPFHRIFNPTLQGERFDPEGLYVRRYVRELADVAAPQCLQPGAGEGLLAPTGYVAPMIDAATERTDALARFHEARDVARSSSSMGRVG
ncbi:MAG: deoxyribodipyrimidine photo-lyase [Actinomycetota bacterium]|nr:deoxyribodipyrimidine photo-lyase [Actinomycetota bacterium]